MYKIHVRIRAYATKKIIVKALNSSLLADFAMRSVGTRTRDSFSESSIKYLS
jgi:hypothetical protein